MGSSHPWLTRQRRIAAIVAACLFAAGVAARRAGLPDPLCGVLLSVSVAGVLSWLAGTIVRRSGLGIPEAAAWSLGLAVASAGTVLASVWPGERLATGLVATPGEALRLHVDRPERVLLLVSADVLDPGQVAFDLRAGDELISGELVRGTRRWSVGDDQGHTHLDRASLVATIVAPAGEVELLLARSSAPGLALSLTTYRERLPPWLPAVAALCALLAFAWRATPLGGGREAVMAATAAVLIGLAAGAAATPAHAMGAGIRGLFVGLLGGLPLGALLAQVMSRPWRAGGKPQGRGQKPHRGSAHQARRPLT